LASNGAATDISHRRQAPPGSGNRLASLQPRGRHHVATNVCACCALQKKPLDSTCSLRGTGSTKLPEHVSCCRRVMLCMSSVRDDRLPALAKRGSHRARTTSKSFNAASQAIATVDAALAVA
jgi:hypothetical protein